MSLKARILIELRDGIQSLEPFRQLVQCFVVEDDSLWMLRHATVFYETDQYTTTLRWVLGGDLDVEIDKKDSTILCVDGIRRGDPSVIASHVKRWVRAQNESMLWHQ